MTAIVNYVIQNYALIITVAFGVSEALSMIPQIKSNGLFSWIFNMIVWVKNAVIK